MDDSDSESFRSLDDDGDYDDDTINKNNNDDNVDNRRTNPINNEFLMDIDLNDLNDLNISGGNLEERKIYYESKNFLDSLKDKDFDFLKEIFNYDQMSNDEKSKIYQKTDDLSNLLGAMAEYKTLEDFYKKLSERFKTFNPNKIGISAVELVGLINLNKRMLQERGVDPEHAKNFGRSSDQFMKYNGVDAELDMFKFEKLFTKFNNLPNVVKANIVQGRPKVDAFANTNNLRNLTALLNIAKAHSSKNVFGEKLSFDLVSKLKQSDLITSRPRNVNLDELLQKINNKKLQKMPFLKLTLDSTKCSLKPFIGQRYPLDKILEFQVKLPISSFTFSPHHHSPTTYFILPYDQNKFIIYTKNLDDTEVVPFVPPTEKKLSIKYIYVYTLFGPNFMLYDYIKLYNDFFPKLSMTNTEQRRVTNSFKIL